MVIIIIGFLIELILSPIFLMFEVVNYNKSGIKKNKIHVLLLSSLMILVLPHTYIESIVWESSRFRKSNLRETK